MQIEASGSLAALREKDADRFKQQANCKQPHRFKKPHPVKQEDHGAGTCRGGDPKPDSPARQSCCVSKFLIRSMACFKSQPPPPHRRLLFLFDFLSAAYAQRAPGETNMVVCYIRVNRRNSVVNHISLGNHGFLCGCGSKLHHRGIAGFSPWFHLPGFRFDYLFLTSHVVPAETLGCRGEPLLLCLRHLPRPVLEPCRLDRSGPGLGLLVCLRGWGWMRLGLWGWRLGGWRWWGRRLGVVDSKHCSSISPVGSSVRAVLGRGVEGGWAFKVPFRIYQVIKRQFRRST